jgi:hypothetical protein
MPIREALNAGREAYRQSGRGDAGMGWRSRRHQDLYVWGFIILPWVLSHVFGWFDTGGTSTILIFAAYFIIMYAVARWIHRALAKEEAESTSEPPDNRPLF